MACCAATTPFAEKETTGAAARETATMDKPGEPSP